MTFKFELGLDC